MLGRRMVTYEEWETTVPASMRDDSAWRMRAYRLGLFLADLAVVDAGAIYKDRIARSHADQLIRAVGSISANVVEGYSRGSGKERAHFFGYALGSARESRDWYYKCRTVLKESVVAHRLAICNELVKLLLVMVGQERRTNRGLMPSNKRPPQQESH